MRGPPPCPRRLAVLLALGLVLAVPAVRADDQTTPARLAVSSLSGVTNMAANLALHAIGIAVLLLVLLVPSLGRGVDRRLAGHLRHGT